MSERPNGLADGRERLGDAANTVPDYFTLGLAAFTVVCAKFICK